MKRFSAFAVSAALLCACGGHGGSSALPATRVASTAHGATLTITIPPKSTTASSSRAPQYVSPATESLEVVVDAGGSNPQTFAENIASGATNCNVPSPLAPLTCTVNLPVAAGAHTFDMTTYDQPLDINGNVQGSPLSANVGFPFTVVQGQVNNIGITLQGIPAGISIVPIPPSGLTASQDISGDQETGFNIWGVYETCGCAFSRLFFVVATDADGNFILGTGAPTITMLSSDNTTLSDGQQVAPTSPNIFGIIPFGTPDSTYDYTITATPNTAAGSDSGSSPLTIHVPMVIKAYYAPTIYIPDSGSNVVSYYDDIGDYLGQFGTAGGLGAIAYAPNTGLLYADVGGSIAVYNQAGAVQGTIGAFPASATLAGIVYDPHNADLYVGVVGGGINVYDQMGNALSVSGTWKDTGGTLAFAAGGVYDPSNGHLYFADSANSQVEEYDDSGNYVTEWSVSAPTAIARDAANGWLYVTTGAGVQVFDDTGTAITLPGNAFSQLATQALSGIVYNPASGGFQVTQTGSSTYTAWNSNGDFNFNQGLPGNSPVGPVLVP